MVIFLHMKCKSCMLWRIVHSVYKFRYSILAFGHSLWVHQRGLFSVNTAGVWYLRGRYKPTWKPYRSTDTPMYAGVCVYVCMRLAETTRVRGASHVKICTFKCMFVWVLLQWGALRVSVGVCLSEWCLCRWAGARSEGVRQAWTQPQTPRSFPLSGSMWMWGDTLDGVFFCWSGRNVSLKRRQEGLFTQRGSLSLLSVSYSNILMV